MTDDPEERPESFSIKDCALIAIATGQRAQNLKELATLLATIDAGSIYYHFWGGLLRPRFHDPEFGNDFAIWAAHGLHDAKLAERLSLTGPPNVTEIEDLRRSLLDVVEERLDESEWIPWAKSSEQFHFIRSQLVVFDTGIRVPGPENLREVVPHLSQGSIFYHFIEARRRTPERTDDFSKWLLELGPPYEDLVSSLANIDYYMVPVSELRTRLSALFSQYFEGKTP